MMQARGHEVILYWSEDSDSSSEVVSCISKAEQMQLGFHGPEDYLKADFDHTKPLFSLFNANVIEALNERIEPKDYLLLSMGASHQPVIDAFPKHLRVEYGIGYSGISMSTFRVFESVAWRHFVSGIYELDGQFYDEVIPNYFDISQFPTPPSEPDDYFLYIGRLTTRKGYQIAVDACQSTQSRLKIAGVGDIPSYGEYQGMVGPEQRGELMANAVGVFTPTLYIGPFEGVSVEANICGTPVITTDWGSYSENVIEGFNGFRCKSMRDFRRAMDLCVDVDRQAIREWAIERFSTESVGAQYEEYFERLATLWGPGFYG